MIDIIIDGKKVKARKGEYLLGVARREGFDIPALCHHEAVEPSGACRLCMVEITRSQWDGWSKVVTSCLYPAEDGLIVKTMSQKVRDIRREVLELLLARSPRSDVVRKLARDYGVHEPVFEVDFDGDDCILCGICTRICGELVTGAIARVNRGVEKKVDTPFSEISDACIGCLACAKSCPTGAIEFSASGLKRKIWGRTFDVVPCTVCGAPTVTREQAAWLASQDKGLSEDDLYICKACKAKRTAETYEKISW